VEPGKLRELLAVLREGGVKSATVPVSNGDTLHVEFAAVEPQVSASPFVDAKGKPINLDEGAGELTRDPDADPIEAANFPGKAKPAGS
jgi:hypothetical protein